jgi:hypothetical protein
MLFLLCSAFSFAQDVQLTPEAQVRPRLEVDSVRGAGSDVDPVAFVSMRSRLGATLSHEDVAIRVVVSDVRYFGEATDTRRSFSANGLDVRIATATWSPNNWRLTVGRMEEPLLNQRLLATANWRPEGRVFDGGRIRWSEDAWTVEARGHLIDEGDDVQLDVTDQAVPDGRDTWLGTFYVQFRSDPLRIAPQSLFQSGPNLVRSTNGVLMTGGVAAVDYSLEGYHQSGTVDDATISAAMAGAEVGLSPMAPLRLALAYDVLTGDPDLTDDRATAFNTLYSANHKYYGHADMAVFYVGGFKDGQGLQDAIFRARYDIGSTRFLANQHLFLATVPTDEALLAYETDLQVQQSIADGLDGALGANFWLSANDTPDEYMLWLQLNAHL